MTGGGGYSIPTPPLGVFDGGGYSPHAFNAGVAPRPPFAPLGLRARNARKAFKARRIAREKIHLQPQTSAHAATLRQIASEHDGLFDQLTSLALQNEARASALRSIHEALEAGTA